MGDPIKVRFFDGIEFIEGEANSIEIISSSLILKDEVSIIKSGNKIRSDEIIIKLGKDIKIGWNSEDARALDPS